MKPLRVGRHRQRLSLYSPATTETFDSFAQPVPNPTLVGTYWGYLRPLSGHEAIVAKQVKAEATHGLTTRYLGSAIAICPTWYWMLGARKFGIASIQNIEERNRQYEFILVEIQQSGSV